ncbi:hypothetical protein D3C73_1073000 [compost metagenome]
MVIFRNHAPSRIAGQESCAQNVQQSRKFLVCPCRSSASPDERAFGTCQEPDRFGDGTGVVIW